MSDGELTRLEVLRDSDQCRLKRVTPKSLHGVDLGVVTLRQWMIDAGLWVRRKDRLKRIHQPRARRDCLGELVQIDGFEHWWFEDRGLQCRLLVYSLPP